VSTEQTTHRWARLAERARETNRIPTDFKQPVTEPGSWTPAFVVISCLILVLGVVVLCWLKKGPVW
jgi:hypothetical protein